MSRVFEELEGQPEINLLNLAKLAIQNGNHILFKQYRFNHAYNKKKQFEQEKATSGKVAVDTLELNWDLTD